VSGHRRTLLTITHSGDLRIGCPLQQQGAPYRLRAALAEPDVVFARAALVRVPLEAHTRGGVSRQVLGVRSHDVRALTLDLAAVEVEVDGALGEQPRLRPGDLIVGTAAAGVGIAGARPLRAAVRRALPGLLTGLGLLAGAGAERAGRREQQHDHHSLHGYLLRHSASSATGALDATPL